MTWGWVLPPHACLFDGLHGWVVLPRGCAGADLILELLHRHLLVVPAREEDLHSQGI